MLIYINFERKSAKQRLNQMFQIEAQILLPELMRSMIVTLFQILTKVVAWNGFWYRQRWLRHYQWNADGGELICILCTSTQLETKRVIEWEREGEQFGRKAPSTQNIGSYLRDEPSVLFRIHQTNRWAIRSFHIIVVAFSFLEFFAVTCIFFFWRLTFETFLIISNFSISWAFKLRSQCRTFINPNDMLLNVASRHSFRPTKFSLFLSKPFPLFPSISVNVCVCI